MIKKTDPADEGRIARLNELLYEAERNRDLYDKKTKAELRTMFYENGIDVSYKTHNKAGDVIKTETVHYKMLYRTPGKAKKGTVMFISRRLYKKARDFLYMGIKLPRKNAPLVEIGAYSSLITSSVVGRIKIDPSEILILKDVESFFTTSVVSIEADENAECVARRYDEYRVKNTMFDGQALIDKSIFPAWGDGYILLRHHMFKAAAFCTNIQMFFRDYFGEAYETATVTDMWGNEIPARNVRLITTDNALKWLKFGVSFEYWSEWVRKNNSLFGIVKTAHPSKLGEVQRMSYQMVNSLDLDTMDDVIVETDTYIRQLKEDDDVFLSYLEKNKNFSTDYEALIALVNQDWSFIQSEYFRERRQSIIKAYVMNVRSGKLIQRGENLTIVGSPYAMLLHAVGENPEDDPTFDNEDDCIQCYTRQYGYNEYIAAFRSPFNSRNNMMYLHNNLHPLIDKYFNLGKLTIAVNLRNTDLQDRSNGSDQDSDTFFTSNQPSIVAHAKMCYEKYPTIVNNIPKEKNQYSNKMESYAIIDNKLAKSQTAIGESSNLAQLALTYTYNFENQMYDDIVCILSVVAQLAIDNAKRTCLCDIPSEIKRLKKMLDIPTNGYPAFWTIIKPDFSPTRNGESVINRDLQCPMNYLYDYRPPRVMYESETFPMDKYFVNFPMMQSRKRNKRIEELIEKYALDLYRFNGVGDNRDGEEYLLLRQDYDDMINDIRQIYISNNYLPLMSWLINRAFLVTPNIVGKRNILQSTLKKNRALLIKTLYDVSPKQFLQVFAKNCDFSGQQEKHKQT